jgi:hypothetical protein
LKTEESLTQGGEPEANKATVRRDPEVLIVHRKVVYSTGQISLA